VIPSATGHGLESESMEKKQEKVEDVSPDSDVDLSVAVMRSKSESVEDVSLEAYVEGVVASEMPVDTFEVEALKAQALAARTYIVNHLLHKPDLEEGDVTDTVQHQVY